MREKWSEMTSKLPYLLARPRDDLGGLALKIDPRRDGGRWPKFECDVSGSISIAPNQSNPAHPTGEGTKGKEEEGPSRSDLRWWHDVVEGGERETERQRPRDRDRDRETETETETETIK